MPFSPVHSTLKLRETAGVVEPERSEEERTSAHFSQVFGTLSLNNSNTSLDSVSGGYLKDL